MNKKLFTIFLILLISFDTIPCKNLVSMASTVATITSDNEKDLYFAISTMNDNGGVIYIDTPIINISLFRGFTLSGTKPGGIYGLRQSNGAYPIINFKNARNNKGSNPSAFTITGSNKYMKFLIIEHSGFNAILIYGSYNNLDHIITRYNNGNGIDISDKTNGNTLNYCYSYRNFNTKILGLNTSGFAITSKIVFNYCYAWDNSGNGYSIFDMKNDNSANVQYLHSACWNNGNPDVFTGKYDFLLRRSLDKNMWTIEQLIESDPSFEINYAKRIFSIDNGKIAGMSAKDWIEKQYIRGNGFQFGDYSTGFSTSIKRKAVYSVAFDHKLVGFDNNESQGCSGYIENCVSFNNNINYQLPFEFEKWSNNWSWNPIKADQFRQNEGLKVPNNKDDATEQFYAIRNKIMDNCAHNTFDDSVNFDSVIRALA